ncbi:hypothetical protein [Marinobacter adhaerens]|uniref:hypothetical protein n=1 Tax=Marinobacter adhaerens TaxID=1033846 RepID=UPI003D149FD5
MEKNNRWHSQQPRTPLEPSLKAAPNYPGPSDPIAFSLLGKTITKTPPPPPPPQKKKKEKKRHHRGVLQGEDGGTRAGDEEHLTGSGVFFVGQQVSRENPAGSALGADTGQDLLVLAGDEELQN